MNVTTVMIKHLKKEYKIHLSLFEILAKAAGKEGKAISILNKCN